MTPGTPFPYPSLEIPLAMVHRTYHVDVVQVVLAPHFYCPEVSGADACFSGQTMYDSLDKSVGYLTVAPGWCKGSDCKVSLRFP